MSSGRVRRRWTKSFARPARNGVSGDGGLDLLALLRALPENLPLSLEVPALDLLARGVDGAERARLAIERTRALPACSATAQAGCPFA